MPDREYIIDIILKARDETARAFAEATGNMEAYNALLDEQKAKSRAAKQAQHEYVDEINHGDTTLRRYKNSVGDLDLIYDRNEKKVRNVVRAQRDLEQAQNRVTKSQRDGKGGTAEYALAMDNLLQKQRSLSKALQEYDGRSRQVAQADAQRSQKTVEVNVRLQEQARLLDAAARAAEEKARREAAAVEAAARRKSAAEREYETIVRQIAQAEQARETARVASGTNIDRRNVIKESLDIDVTRARTRLDEFRASERAREIDIHVRVPDRDVELARAKLDVIRSGGGRGGGGRGGGRGGGGGTIPLSGDPDSGSGGSGSAVSAVKNLQNAFSSLDTTTSGFEGHFRSAFGFAVVTLIQPIAALLVGLVATMGALASAAIAAGTALGVTFISGIAQGIPVIGLFAAAMERLTQIFSYVQAAQQQLQQRFIAQYETAQQNAMGINQVVIAQHNYSDALYASQQAVINVTSAEHSYGDALFSQQNAVYAVRVAQLGLLTARRDAARQLQQLIFEETNARLAAEASTLAITQSEKALAASVATGGDVQSAQLQLMQAHAQHTQAVTQAQQAISDAAPGSIARQNISQTVEQARQGVQQAVHAVSDANFALRQAEQGIVTARRAVIDAQFQVAQARAAIIQAQQAAAGYNLATAAQLAWLRSQMTETERSLADNITKIYQMFQGVHGRLRPVTDAILSAFVPLTGQIIKVLNDPRIFGALLNLGHKMGDAIRQLTNAVFSNQSLNSFIRIINAAAENLRPLATAISNIFRGVQAIIITAIPYVHQFAGFIAGLTQQFADWANSTRGQNWLKQFFDVGFQALRAFVNLGISVVRLFLAIAGPGGGAHAGIKVIQDLTGWINHATDSINNHGRVWKDLQRLWSTIGPTLSALGTILGAIVRGFIELGTSQQGRSSLSGLAQLIAHILVPAFVQFAEIIGHATNILLGFLARHPALEKFLVTLIAVSAAASIGFKAIGLIFGPLAQVLRVVGALAEALGPLGELLAVVFTGPVGIIAAIVSGIVLLAAWTGKLQQLWDAVSAPFVAVWNAIRQPIQGLIQNFQYMMQSLDHLGGAFRVLRSIVGTILGNMFHDIQYFGTIIGNILGRAFGDVIKIISNLFRLIGDVLRGHWGAVLRDFENIGKAMLDGIWNALTALPKLIIAAFTLMVRSAMRQAHLFVGVGRAMLDGIVFVFVTLPEKILGIIGHLIGLIAGFGKKVWNAGWTLGDNIFKGIVSAFSGLIGFFKGIINDAIIAPINWVIDRINGLPHISLPFGLGNVGIPHLGHVGKLAEGGPVDEGGYGGGDRHLTLLESGEHVITKEEVRAAGGHGAIFAMRQILGGGGQGGRGKYAVGGQVGQDGGMGQLGLQNPRGQTTQGVTGLMGSVLANIQAFTKQAINDWNGFWSLFNKITQTNMDWEIKEWRDRFNDILSNLKDVNKNLTDQIKGFWDDTNKVVSDQLGKLVKNFKASYKTFDTDTFNAFWYIWKAASQALTVFGATTPKLQLANIPKFAGGGFIGQMGERGQDLVHAVLGRGEAVLNWAQQSFVDPAMKAYYGFGLDRLFEKVRGQHAADHTGYQGPMKARPNKFASGGYVFPFPQGQTFSWARVDQGQDLQTTPGGLILAIAPGVVRPASDRFSGFGGHYAEQAITGGPLSGRSIYYGHIWANKFGNVNAGDVIGRTQTKANQWTAAPAGWLELGFLPYGSMSAGNAIAPILHALAAGHRVSASMAGAGGGAPGAAAWTDITKILVKGRGMMKNALQAAINKVTDAANSFGSRQGGSAAGFTGTLSGPVEKQVRDFMSAVGFNKIAIAGMLGNAAQESSMNPNTAGGGLWQQISNFGQGTGGSLLNQMKTMLPQIIGLRAALNSAGSPESAAAIFMNKFERPAAWAANLAHRQQAAAQAYASGYAGGGFIGGARKLIGHVGEWVVNQAQQSRLANRLGTTVGALRDSMGFTGGPDSFAGGGVIGENPIYSRTTGAYSDPAGVVFDTPGFTSQAISVYNAAQSRISNAIERNARNLGKGIQTFLSNYSQVGGDNGIFALAAQAIQDYVNQQTSFVQLAAAGVRVVSDALRLGRAQTAVQQAQSDLDSTQRQITRELTLQRQEVTALHAVEQQIRRLGRPTQSNLATWQRLQGARQNLVNAINTSDQTLAQSYADQYSKQSALFTAQVTEILRGGTTLSGGQVGAVTIGVNPGRGSGLQATFDNLRGILGRVGPTIAAGLAQMAQSIAQTLQDPSKLAISDQAIVDAATQQHEALQTAYTQAAARAARDPRWQTVADDLLQQLESSVTSLVQAEAQALQDAVQSQDTQQQIGNAALQLRDTLAQALAASSSVAGPANQYAASAMQIQTSQARAGFLSQQIGAYQGLLGQAQAQGNIGVANTLIQTIDQLTGELAQANLQTQQLITSNRQLAVTILNSQTQATNGFFQAAQGIAQTLGAIAGNQNLPALIAYARQAGQALIQEGQNALANIAQALSPDGSGAFAFGANQGGAGSLLDQLTTAFGQGPQTFANVLAQMAPRLAGFEAGLPQDQQTLFQNLVQSLVDNTTAQVNNTQQLQQLNATTNQQQFTSSAWTMFRDAIFNGLGGLLPQYAMTVPSLDAGGVLASSGILYGHAGEGIVPAEVMRGQTIGTKHTEHHWNITNPTEVADPVALGNAVAWRLNHDPNSR